jgi:glycosyltransferase involved in cell wall biosynthesis
MLNKFFDRRGGTERLLFDLSASLAERGHEVIPFATQDPRNEATPYSSFFPEKRDYDGRSPWKRARLAARAIYDGEARRLLERLLDEHPCDVAHLHNIYHQLSPSVLDALRSRSVPTLMTVHDYKLVCPNYRLFRGGAPCEKCVGTPLPLWAGVHRCQRNSVAESWLVAVESSVHRLRRSYENGVDAFVAPSEFLRSMLLRHGFAAERVRHIRNAPRLYGAAKTTTKRASRPTVFYAGRLSEEKGLSVLLEAARELPGLDIRVAGEGPLADTLRRRYGSLSHVEFLGQLDDGALADERARCWAMALPALWYENAPMSVIEAFAAGRPVLVADHGGLTEMVEEGKQGWRIAPGDVAAWRQALRRLMEAGDELGVMGEEAARWHRQRYSHDQMMRAYLELYAELAAADRVSSPGHAPDRGLA